MAAAPENIKQRVEVFASFGYQLYGLAEEELRLVEEK